MCKSRTQRHSTDQKYNPISSPPQSLNCIDYKDVTVNSYLLIYMNLDDNIAALGNSFTRRGSKFGIPPFLKKLGSATSTTKSRVETSIVCTRTARRLNS